MRSNGHNTTIAKALGLDVSSVAMMSNDSLRQLLEQRYQKTTVMKNHCKDERIKSDKILLAFCDYLEGAISASEYERRVHEIRTDKTKLHLDF